MIDRRQSDPWGFLPTDRNRFQKCFECGVKTTGRHHVVPVSLGGKKQIPLCGDCHEKVHRKISLSDLVKAALNKKKESGFKLGTPVKIKPDLVKKILTRRQKGETIRKIAEALDISIGSVHSVIKSAQKGVF